MSVEDEIINLEDKEEPWCSHCLSHTDYKIKWTTFPRANLDGGTYSEIDESPYCINCGNLMHKLSTCRIIVWSVRVACLLLFLLWCLLCFFLYEISYYTVLAWLVGIFVLVLVSKSPRKSRKALSTHRFSQHKSKLLN
jgi:hypothetical protein